MERELNLAQQRLADLLKSTEVDGKASRVIWVDGKPVIESESRKVNIIDEPRKPGEFALKLHEKNPTAEPSPYFVNFRNLPEEVLRQCGVALDSMDLGGMPKFCTGIPTAGEPIAQIYSEISGIKYRKIFKKEEHPDGTRTIKPDSEEVNGDCQTLLIVDDLVTGADTKVEAVRAAESLGYQVHGVAVVLDREQGGREQLEKEGIKLFAALPISLVFSYYHKSGQITAERYKKVMAYMNSSK